MVRDDILNRELLDFMLSISEDNYDEFMKKSNISLETSNNLEVSTIDYSWIDIVEKYIPFLKNAVDNPYQEIMDEADSKKLYENRFLVSLIMRLDSFVRDKYNQLIDRLENSYERDILIKGKAKLELEDVEFDIALKSKRKEDSSAGESYGMSAKERIKRLVKVLDSVTSSNFFTSLNDIKLVSSPIHRTNVIMEDQNFKKLLELWDFLENYLLFQKTFNNKKIQQKQQESLKQKINHISFINYQLFNSVNDISGASESYYKDFLEKIIEGLVNESTMDDKTFKRLVNKKFEEEYTKKQNREKNILANFNKSIDSYQKQIKDAIRCLK